MNHLETTITAITLLFAPGCSNATPADPKSELLDPPPAGKGVQFSMVTTIPAGTEAEHCRFVQVPPEGLVINRDEVRYTEGSHHFLVYETAYQQIPTQNDEGKAVDTSGVFDCTDGPTNGWSVRRLIGGSQNADGDAMLSFPDDVGLTVAGNTVLLMNAHYVNASTDDLEPEVRVNFWTIPESQRRHEGDILFLYDIFIDVPGQSKARAHQRCPVYDDITITNAQSHMHTRGTGYRAFVDGEPLYDNDRWEDVPVARFEGGVDVAAGSVLEYWCDYDNPESRNVLQGPRSTDEMCMLIGSFYPASPGTSLCASDPEQPADTQSLGAEWVGDGDASCAETMGCVQTAFDSDTTFDDVQRCVNAAAPEVAKEVSDAVRCVFTHDVAECGAEIAACAQK